MSMIPVTSSRFNRFSEARGDDALEADTEADTDDDDEANREDEDWDWWRRVDCSILARRSSVYDKEISK